MSHDVTFDIPRCDLGKADIHVKVKLNSEMLGKLEVSKGSVVWYPKDHTYGHKATWREFDEIMKKRFPKRERRKKT